MENKETLTRLLVGFIKTASIRLPDDVEARIRELAADEKDGVGKDLYGCMLENIELAKAYRRPICQDTGMLQFFVKVGTKFPLIDSVEDCIREASLRATESIPLRPNVVEPLGERNTGNNAGYGTPYIEWELEPNDDGLSVMFYAAGGGCSLPGRSKVLMPLEGVEGVKKFVYDTILDWGVNACPPLLVGIGLGTCAVTSAMLSKKAVLRRIGTHCENEKGARLERELQAELDTIGIAPLGFGGRHSVLAVHVECAGHHPATLGVGITTSCWATRRGGIVIDRDLNAHYTMHTVGEEV